MATLDSLQLELNALSTSVSNTVLPISTYDLHASDNEVRIHALEISRQAIIDSIQSLISLIQSLQTVISDAEAASDTADGALQAAIDEITGINSAFYTEYSATKALLASLQFDLVSEISRVESDAFGNHNIALTQVGIVNNALQSAVVQLTTLESNFNTNVASVNQSLSTFATQSSAIATDLTELETQINGIDFNSFATVIQLDQAKSDIFSASASSFTNVRAEYSGLIGTVTSQISTVASDVAGVESKYGVQVVAGSTTGGFAITGISNNDGTETSTKFTVLADTFKVVSSANDDGIAPFVITDSKVKMNGDVIVNGTLTADQILSSSLMKGGTYGINTPSSVGSTTTSIGSVPGQGEATVLVGITPHCANALLTTSKIRYRVTILLNGSSIGSKYYSNSGYNALNASTTTGSGINPSAYVNITTTPGTGGVKPTVNTLGSYGQSLQVKVDLDEATDVPGFYFQPAVIFFIGNR